MANYQTIYALSTGSLPSAIAVVRVSGPSTQKVLKLLVNQVPKPRKLMLKEIKTAEQEIIDIALVCFFPKTEAGEILRTNGGVAAPSCCSVWAGPRRVGRSTSCGRAVWAGLKKTQKWLVNTLFVFAISTHFCVLGFILFQP